MLQYSTHERQLASWTRAPEAKAASVSVANPHISLVRLPWEMDGIWADASTADLELEPAPVRGLFGKALPWALVGGWFRGFERISGKRERQVRTHANILEWLSYRPAVVGEFDVRGVAISGTLMTQA